VLAYLSRYTHSVVISNPRLISLDDTGVTFLYKDYRRDGMNANAPWRSQPASSSGAYCSIFCQGAFTASSITICWPVVGQCGSCQGTAGRVNADAARL